MTTTGCRAGKRRADLYRHRHRQFFDPVPSYRIFRAQHSRRLILSRQLPPIAAIETAFFRNDLRFIAISFVCVDRNLCFFRKHKLRVIEHCVPNLKHPRLTYAIERLGDDAIFLAVARGGSLRASAAIMNANHATVKRNIRVLEATYGVQPFTRSRRGFQLTAVGEALLPLVEEAERVFQGARRRVDGLDKTETRTIRFSLSPMMAYDMVAPILARFSELIPGSTSSFV